MRALSTPQGRDGKFRVRSAGEGLGHRLPAPPARRIPDRREHFSPKSGSRIERSCPTPIYPAPPQLIVMNLPREGDSAHQNREVRWTKSLAPRTNPVPSSIHRIGSRLRTKNGGIPGMVRNRVTGGTLSDLPFSGLDFRHPIPRKCNIVRLDAGPAGFR